MNETDLNEFFEDDPYVEEFSNDEFMLDDSDFKLPTLKTVLEDKQINIE